MNNSSIIFSNTGRLSGGGTQNPGTLSGRTEVMSDYRIVQGMIVYLVAPGTYSRYQVLVPGNISVVGLSLT